MALTNRELAASLASALVRAVDQKMNVEVRQGKRAKKQCQPAREGPPCYFCGKPLIKGDAFLEFADEERSDEHGPRLRPTHVRVLPDGIEVERGSLTYPGNGQGNREAGHWRDWRSVALLTHTNCGPDGFYWITFDRIYEENFLHHCREKTWWSSTYEEAWMRVCEVAKALGYKSKWQPCHVCAAGSKWCGQAR